MGRTDLALRLTGDKSPRSEEPGGRQRLSGATGQRLANFLRWQRGFVVVGGVTLVTNWLRPVDLSIRLLTLGGFFTRQENHLVERGS